MSLAVNTAKGIYRIIYQTIPLIILTKEVK